MPRLSRTTRKNIAFFVWLAGLFIAAGVGWWAYEVNAKDADNRLIGDAARAAGELAGLLSYSEYQNDPEFSRVLAAGALEDERVYAVKITITDKLKEGLRRNYLWEPIPWDDEIAENSIQGMYPVKHYGKTSGRVEVWISTRAVNEEKALMASREVTRFAIFAFLWSGVFFLILWQWGDIQRWVARLKAENSEAAGAEKIILQLSREQREEEELEERAAAPVDEKDVVNAIAGRRYQQSAPDSWLVTAGMFRQTFGRGPALMNRLYADGEIAGLCHLGRMLEQAAPCIGADKLLQCARDMQKKLNNPNANDEATAVEECARALEEVLEALCGNGKGQSRPEDARS